MTPKQPVQHQQLGGLPFKRTICSCNVCRTNCKVIPGYLVCDDIYKIYYFMNPVVDYIEFIKLYFLSSNGAIVMKNCNMVRIPTIVPRRDNKGHCVFLTQEEKCRIHPVAPFGCRYFDCKQTKEEADEITKCGLNQIAGSVEYREIWVYLRNRNLIAIPPEQAREKFYG